MTDLSVNRDKRARSQTETFEIAISGLLTKRADLFGESERLRSRLGEIDGDLAAIDRTLSTLGYKGALNVVSPRRSTQANVGRGETMRAVLDVLRQAQGPLVIREIADQAMGALGLDVEDGDLAVNYARRVSKCLQRLKVRGDAERAPDGRGSMRWWLQTKQ